MRYGPDDPKVQETLTIIRRLNANPSLPNMKNYLQHVDVLDSDAHDSLRQIFEDVSTMTEEEMDIFAAALDAESINGLDDILLIEQSLDAYTFWPDVTSDRELGVYLVESNYVWASPDIAPFVDYTMLGASYSAAHGGAYGPKGYAQRTGDINPVFKAVIGSQETDETAIAFLPLHASQVRKITEQLSYLKPEEQSLLLETIESEQATPSLSQAQRIKKLSQSGDLNEDSILSIMAEQKKPELSSNITLSGDKLKKYFSQVLYPRAN